MKKLKAVALAILLAAFTLTLWSSPPVAQAAGCHSECGVFDCPDEGTSVCASYYCESGWTYCMREKPL